MTTLPQQQQQHTTEIKRSDIIQLILQFLKECDFKQAFQALQAQSKISLNIADRTELADMIMNSQWEELFKYLNYLMPSPQNLFDLYELVVDDLIDKNAFAAASFVVSKCIKGSLGLVEDNREKILRMEYICENPNQKALHHKPPTHSRRENIINRLLKETHQEIEQGRLLTLITQALRYQATQGLIVPQLGLSYSYSLLEGKQKVMETENQQFINKVQKMMRYDEESRVTALEISNKGEYIAIGGIDGLIEIYQPLEYSLHTGLGYQAEGVMLFHDDSVELLNFSETDEMLVSVDIKGLAKLWNTHTGQLLRKIEYGSTVGCVAWGVEPSHLLLAHQTISLYGIRSCSILKQYRNSTENAPQYLLSIQVASHNNKLYSFGQNGGIKVYNYQTQQLINHTNINVKGGGGLLQVLSIHQRTSRLIGFCISSSSVLLEIDLQLNITHKSQSKEDNVIFQAVAFGRNYLYECIGKEHGKEYWLRIREKDQKSGGSILGGKVVQTIKLDSNVQKINLHQFRNLLITYHEDDSLSFWRP